MSNPNAIPTSFRTNVGSLVAQLAFNRSAGVFNTAVRNLSTGIAIHSGRDDPSAFLATSTYATQIASMAQAVQNNERSGAMLQTSDAALSQVNALLIDLRGIVTEAANSGANTDPGIDALQLEVDSILDEINRIATSTAFQDKTLLNGSLAFTTVGVDSRKIDSVVINQANFGNWTEKEVSVKILETPKKASLQYPLGATTGDVTLQVSGNLGSHVCAFNKGTPVGDILQAVNLFSDSTGVVASVYSDSTPGSIALTSYGTDNDVLLTASEPGSLPGNMLVKYTAPPEGNDTLTLNYTAGSGNDPGRIEILLQTDTDGTVLTTAEQVVTLLNTAPELKDSEGNGIVSASLPAGTTGRGTVTPFSEYSYYGSTDDRNRLQFLAPAGTPTLRFTSDPNTPLSIEDTSLDGTLTIHLETDGNGVIKTTANDLVKFFDHPSTEASKAVLDKYGISVSGIDPESQTLPNCTRGISEMGTGALKISYDPDDPAFCDGVPLELQGTVYPQAAFTSGGDGDDGAPMLGNRDKAALGITFHSADYGADAFVEVIPIDGTFPLVDRSGRYAERSYGTDVRALINDMPAIGSGNVASLAMPDLDIAIAVSESVRPGEVLGIRIDGGGAIMQLGQDATPSQQVRVALPNVQVTRLGGPDGTLDDLRDGKKFSMTNDTNGAFRMIESAIGQVSQQRGRLGAVQKHQVESHMNFLMEEITHATEADAEIKDTDFAEWSSTLSRTQVLMQTALTVIGKAGENTQALLQLLQR